VRNTHQLHWYRAGSELENSVKDQGGTLLGLVSGWNSVCKVLRGNAGERGKVITQSVSPKINESGGYGGREDKEEWRMN